MSIHEEDFVSANGGKQKDPNNVDRPTLDEAAFHGIVGDIVKMFDPHTEADQAAILIQTLVMAGNCIGSGPHFEIEGDLHRTVLFVILVGVTGKGRKGTSGGRVRSLFRLVDEDWELNRVKSGLSSGEGFVYEVRDETQEYNKKDHK